MTPDSGVDELHGQIRYLRKSRSFAEIRQLLERLSRAELLEDLELCLALASALSYLKCHSQAKLLLLQAEPHVTRPSNKGFLRRWQLLLAIQLIEDGALHHAEQLLLESLAVSEKHSDHRLIADNNNSLGVIQSFRGEVMHAVTYFRRSLVAWQKLGDAQGVGIAHYNLGLVLREWGRTAESVPHFNHAEDYFSREGIDEERVHVTAERALLFSDLGDLVLAERLARTAVQEASALTVVGIKAAALRALGAILQRAGKLDESERTLREALRVLAKEKAGVIRAEVLEELALVSVGLEKHADAERCVAEAASEFLRIGSTNHYDRLKRRYASAAKEGESRYLSPG